MAVERIRYRFAAGLSRSFSGGEWQRRQGFPVLRVWAISDLHLGFSTGKWMDPFGEHWADHHVKVEQAWRERVAPQDIVLMPGDFSWAMKPYEVVRDFEWLAALPGRKVLIKGNHDYWWPGSQKKLRELLPEGVYALKKTAIVLDGVPVIGVRGAEFLPRLAKDKDKDKDEDKDEDKDTEKNDFDPVAACAEVDESLVRERRELLYSIEHLREIYSGPRRPLALFHYPPFRVGTNESAFTRVLESAGASHCLFGHLHTQAEWQRVFQGERNGVTYRLVSCDALEFTPLLVDEVEA